MQSAISRIRTELSFFYGLLTFGEDYSKCDVCRTSAGQLHQIRKNLVRLPESGRGAPCGRPSWAIVASEFRCDCPEDVCGQHWPVSRLILVFYDHNLRWQRCSPCPPRPSASSADKKVLRCSSCPFVDKEGLRCSPCPSAALRVLRGQKGVKVFFVPLRGPSRIKRV